MISRHPKRRLATALAFVLAGVLLTPMISDQTIGHASAQGNNGVVDTSTALTKVTVEPRMLEGTEPWLDLLYRAADESGVPWEVLAAIMNLESGGDPRSLSPSGAVGLMQIMPQYWQAEAGKYGSDLWDPWTNIRTAADILSSAHATWKTWDRAAAAYFGAIDDAGNITGATDAFGTTGLEYVERFLYNVARVGYGPRAANEYVSLALEPRSIPTGAVVALGFALAAQGADYVWSGDSPEEGGFDCSGLIYWAYAQVGISLPRTAAEQWEWTASVDEADLRPGDLIFFSGTTDAPGITHVAMYAGEGLMINAPDINDIVRLVPLNNPWWREHLAGFGRVVLE